MRLDPRDAALLSWTSLHCNAPAGIGVGRREAANTSRSGLGPAWSFGHSCAVLRRPGALSHLLSWVLASVECSLVGHTTRRSKGWWAPAKHAVDVGEKKILAGGQPDRAGGTGCRDLAGGNPAAPDLPCRTQRKGGIFLHAARVDADLSGPVIRSCFSGT